MTFYKVKMVLTNIYLIRKTNDFTFYQDKTQILEYLIILLCKRNSQYIKQPFNG